MLTSLIRAHATCTRAPLRCESRFLGQPRLKCIPGATALPQSRGELIGTAPFGERGVENSLPLVTKVAVVDVRLHGSPIGSEVVSAA